MIGSAVNRLRYGMRFALGSAAALLLVLLAGEAFCRLSPPSDLRDYFGGGDDRRGIYQADPVLGIDYQSYEHFRDDNAARLAELGPLDWPQPTWLFLGNSFVQAPGMLADTAAQARPDHRVFHLRRNEPLPLRVAQARRLLEGGLRPERILFALLPADLWQIGLQPLRFLTATAAGAIATRMAMPEPPWDAAVAASRLLGIAWIRTGRATGDPEFRTDSVMDVPSPGVQQDLTRLLGALGAASRDYGVPATIVIIPNREQVFGQAAFGFQSAVERLSRNAGLDAYDATPVFLAAVDKPSLFLRDWHFTPRGNALLVQGLLTHLQAIEAHADGGATAR